MSEFKFGEEREELTFTPKQLVALQILNQSGVRGLLYGGAKGGGKSVFLCRYGWMYCKSVIDHFNIPVMKNPIPVGFMGRLQGVDF